MVTQVYVFGPRMERRILCQVYRTLTIIVQHIHLLLES